MHYTYVDFIIQIGLTIIICEMGSSREDVLSYGYNHHLTMKVAFYFCLSYLLRYVLVIY